MLTQPKNLSYSTESDVAVSPKHFEDFVKKSVAYFKRENVKKDTYRLISVFFSKENYDPGLTLSAPRCRSKPSDIYFQNMIPCPLFANEKDAISFPPLSISGIFALKRSVG